MSGSQIVISVSVQNLIEYSLQSGDLYAGAGLVSPQRGVEGTRGHNMVRKALVSSLPPDTSYNREVPVSYIMRGRHTILEVTGRIDGVIQSPDMTIIHEIKTTLLELQHIDRDYNLLHWAQAKCYAFMYSHRHGLDNVGVRLTYYSLESGQEKSFDEEYSYKALEEFFLPLAENYIRWLDAVHEWHVIRNNSIKSLSFPYAAYRQEQENFINAVNDCINTGSILLAQAPTGTGKTIASLYPSVKALGEGKISKIFYLTAKTTTRALAEKAIQDMRKKGLKLKSITLTAKEKICLNETFNCDPVFCSFCENYYTSVKDALMEGFQYEHIDRSCIESMAIKHQVCPFELSLDLSLWCDVIICDYNYLFDPRVYLKRFFLNQSEAYCFLVDEAHNLVDRARDMYSAELSKRSLMELKRAVKAELPELSPYIDALYKHMLQISKEINGSDGEEAASYMHVSDEPPAELGKLAAKAAEYIERILSEGIRVSFHEQLLDHYYSLTDFVKKLELYDDHYKTYYEKSSRDMKIKLFCIDPSRLLRQAMAKGTATVLFSATLSPIDYFRRMLASVEDADTLVLPSPFLKENLCVYIDDSVTTRYKARHLSYDYIAESILSAVSCKTGNYMVFFPSFEYLREVYVRFQGIQTGIRTLIQTPGMSEAARQDFLDEFETPGNTTLVGFTVLGGVFGEGIDLTGERLSGAIIVGVGLPLLSPERNIIRRYFDEQSCCGFEYAYLYPGINKVLQAAGRVIRTETDRGIIVLLDERYSSHIYRDLLPPEWFPVLRASDGITLTEALEDFWGQ